MQKEQDTLDTQLKSGEVKEGRETYSSEQLVERRMAKGTPFEVIKLQESENRVVCFGVLGQTRMTGNYATMDEVEAELIVPNYLRILNMMAVVIGKEVELQIQERISKLGTLRERVVAKEQETVRKAGEKAIDQEYEVGENLYGINNEEELQRKFDSDAGA